MAWRDHNGFSKWHIILQVAVVLCSNFTREIAPGVHMPVMSIGLGSGAFGDSVSASTSLGVWLGLGGVGIDIADLTGNPNKHVIPLALARAGLDREQVFITSKVNACANIQTEIDQCLRDLGTTYIDLLLMYDYYMPSSKECSGAWKLFEDYYSKGVVRSIGVSNFHSQSLKLLLGKTRVAPAVNQLHYSLMHADEETRALCDAHDITISSDAPIDVEGLSHSDVRIIAQRSSTTPTQVVLEWIIQNDQVFTFQSFSKEHQQQLAELMQFSGNLLLPDERHTLDALFYQGHDAHIVQNATLRHNHTRVQNLSLKHNHTRDQRVHELENEAHEFLLQHVVFFLGCIALGGWGVYYFFRQRYQASSTHAREVAWNDGSTLEFESFHSDMDA